MRKIVTNYHFAEYEAVRAEDAFQDFIRDKELLNSSSFTIDFYERNIGYFLEFIGDKYVYEITPEDIDLYIEELLERELKIVSINTRLRAVRTFINYCAEKELIKHFKVKMLKDTQEVPDTYTNKELARLLARPKTNNYVEIRTWAFINFAVGTGCRISTIMDIKIRDLDFENQTITLRKVKNRKQQIIPMSTTLSKVLLWYLKGWNCDIDDYLFSSSQKTKCSNRTMQQEVYKYNLKRGVTRTSVHAFRHSFARNYIQAGGDVVKLQQLLGHSNLNITMKYVKLYGDDLKEGYEELNPLNNIMGNKWK